MMALNSWTEVLVEATNKKDMTYSYSFKNQRGQPIWGTKVRPLPGARNFLVGLDCKKNIDYDYTADKKTGQYCYKFKEPENAFLFKLWWDKDSPKNANSHTLMHTCPECGNQFKEF
jgi:hypothetical protein|tara:strand:- start:5790 stop:6137 length:348 start_codon:yes stop_codon:yes gene_type:complete